jgi:7-cyano-7-deazaguanine synthase
MKKKAVILLSGGLDSTTCLAIAKKENFDLFALTINYGQRHKYELKSSKEIASLYCVSKHSIIDIDLAKFGGSALTDDIEVPKNRTETKMSNIPITYVPARNIVFLSIALAWAESLKAYNIFIGVNSVDYSGYPDCRPKFIKSFEETANLATKVGVEGKEIVIHTPLIDLTKKEIIELGLSLGVNYGLTSTCYDPNKTGNPCGSCDACILRLKGFQSASEKDPLSYSS